MDAELHNNGYDRSRSRKARLAVGHSIRSPWLNVQKLGQGSYGTVYHVVHTETRLHAARKMISKERLRLEQQLRIISNFASPFIGEISDAV